MKYGYFPGCYVLSRMVQYDLSARNVLKGLGVELVDLSDAPCCGPAIVKSADYGMASALSAQILAMAESRGVDRLVTLCPECFSSFVKVNYLVEDKSPFREKVFSLLSEATGLRYEGGVVPRHLLQVIHDEIGLERLGNKIVKKFDGLKAAVHPGCHITRASTHYYVEDPENPLMLDRVVESLGIQSLEWPLKLWCCGAATLSFDRELSLNLAGKKLKNIKASKADCIVTSCPYCQMQFDQSQSIIERKLNEKFDIPTILYTQLVGLGMGLSPDDVGLGMNRVSPDRILAFLK